MQYVRMYETRGQRPWYSIPHLGIFAKPLRELSGFSYKKTIYLTSPDLNNQGYFEIDEMAEATKHFSKFWDDQQKTKKLLLTIRQRFKQTELVEKWAWKQNWQKKTLQALLQDIQLAYNTLWRIFSVMIVSQPQHVLPLEEKITKLLEKYNNGSQLLIEATYYPGERSWDKENKEIEELHKKWSKIKTGEKQKALQQLVQKYGWFNEIEGNKPFDAEHYCKRVENFHKEPVYQLKGLKIPEEIKRTGQLIGELGYLRFWTRYHFMTMRYHCKKMLAELVKHSGNPDLEFATVEEITAFFKGHKINLDEIKQRRNGYASIIENDHTKIIIGNEAKKYFYLCAEKFENVTQIRGRIASKGIVRGRARLISFTAPDYDKQVAAFQKSEILVTGMTRPQIVHLCGLASAIVTDEGGITSHAAVISRELGIPCIIATVNATKIIKTGDMIEVDAEKGVVKILNKE